MRDDPQKNLQWLQQELLAAEQPEPRKDITDDTADLLAQVDQLLDELQEPEPPVFVQKRSRQTRGEQMERAHVPKLDTNAAVLTKTKRQLRREAKQQRIAEKKSHVNRRIGDLVVLAVLECIGILWLLGWWMR